MVKSFVLAAGVALVAPLLLSKAEALPNFAIGGNEYVKAVPIFDTYEEGQEAARELNKELTGEGAVLLKNDGTLPLSKKAKVTVFLANASYSGTGSQLAGELRNDGFDVNSNTISAANIDRVTDDQIGNFNDVAVVVIARGGGEGSDLSISVNENADDEHENVGGWKHSRLAKNGDNERKHNQMLTANEIKTIKLAKEKFGSVVVLLNTSNAIEMYNLEHDEDVGAIMFIGRTGTTGMQAVPGLLDGSINPSGKTVDIWYSDFTADPTWYNSLANAQNDGGSNTYVDAITGSTSTNLHGVDYEEDIFLGYGYYETVYAEILAGRLQFDASKAKLTESLVKGDFSGLSEDARKENADAYYERAVVYPFGHGLSYTKFNVGKPQLVEVADFKSEKLASGFAGGEKNVADLKELTFKVKVDNVGNRAGQKVVQIYAAAPYDPAVSQSKAAVKLVGFAKTRELAPGASQTLKIKVNAQDVAFYSASEAHVDAAGDSVRGAYVLDAGEYTFYAGQSSHCFNDNYVAVELDNKAVLALDDFSDENIQNYFSEENGRYNSMKKNGNCDWNGDGAIDENDVLFDEEMTILDRKDLVGTFPQAPKTEKVGEVYKGGLAMNKAFFDLVDYYTNFSLDTWQVSYPAFSISANYAVGDKFGMSNNKDVYQVTEAITAPAAAQFRNYAVDEVFLSGSTVYKVIKAITLPEFPAYDNTRAYAKGEYLTYNGTRYVVKTAFAAGRINTNSRNGNVTAVNNISTFLVTSGDDANVQNITTSYQENILSTKATKLEEQNSGAYKWSDKLFAGIDGKNAKGQTGLFDATPEMMAGWSQLSNAAAQEAAIGAEDSDWIWFNELAGIYFDSKEVIHGGRFDGMTGEQVWVKFMNQWTWEDFFRACWNGGNNGTARANLGIPNGGVADSPTSFNGTYSWCCNTTIGSTWNQALVKYQGELVASLGLLKNSTNMNNAKEQWLNPAINTHRTPFSGRNNEYYSQDGIHAGYMAAACARGIQERGVGCHIKHMALNDQETNRNTNVLFTWVSERAFREIYLKPFQMAIQEGGAEGAMSAFARAGLTPTGVNKNMCDYLVRKEWGAPHFFFHPDFYGAESAAVPEDLMIRTGHSHAPGGTWVTSGTSSNTGANTVSGYWDPEVVNSFSATGKGGVMIGRTTDLGQEAYLSNNQWYAVRYNAMIMYSEYANQGHSRNGILLNDYKGDQTLVATQGTRISNIDVSFDGDVEFENYVIASGALPAGLTLNENTGIISGTPTESGVFNFSVKATLDKWITQTNSYRITVSTTALAAGEVGVAYNQSIVGQSGTFAISEGALPAGLTLAENGRISGTPTEAGTFNFKVSITNGEDVVELSLSIVVAPASPVDHGGIVSIEKIGSEGLVDTYKVTFADGYTFEFTVTNGAQGEKGEQGEQGPAGQNGQDGAQGPQGPQGEQGPAGQDGKDGADGKDGKDGADGAQGPQGPQGEQGPAGPQGPAGADGKDGADAKGCGGSIAAASGIMALIAGLGLAVISVRKNRKED